MPKMQLLEELVKAPAHQIWCLQVRKSQDLLWGTPLPWPRWETRSLTHWAHSHSCPNICIWGMDTGQPNSGWPQQLSVVAKQPQEMELGSLTICLSWWQGWDARAKGS